MLTLFLSILAALAGVWALFKLWAIDGLTSHELTAEQRYGHEPVPVRLKDRVPT